MPVCEHTGIGVHSMSTVTAGFTACISVKQLKLIYIYDRGKRGKGMRLGWLKNPDNIVYADLEEFADNFGNEVGITNLKQEILRFKENPTEKGIVLKGKKRSALKLFVPNLMFDENIEMGENVWVFVGETYPAYCIY